MLIMYNASKRRGKCSCSRQAPLTFSLQEMYISSHDWLYRSLIYFIWWKWTSKQISFTRVHFQTWLILTLAPCSERKILSFHGKQHRAKHRRKVMQVQNDVRANERWEDCHVSGHPPLRKHMHQERFCSSSGSPDVSAEARSSALCLVNISLETTAIRMWPQKLPKLIRG